MSPIFDKTVKFNLELDKTKEVNDIMKSVYEALTEKGYNTINQIVGYILSGDPTYITNHKNARSIISRVERDEILEVLVKYYLVNNLAD